jgi:hypothetical protein
VPPEPREKRQFRRLRAARAASLSETCLEIRTAPFQKAGQPAA